jgi:hypothetical protein
MPTLRFPRWDFTLRRRLRLLNAASSTPSTLRALPPVLLPPQIPPRAMDPSASSAATRSVSSGAKRRGRPSGSRNKPKVPALWTPRAGGPLRIGAPPHGTANHAAPGTSIALTLWGPAPGGDLNASSPAVATRAPRPAGSIDRALREVEAALGPLPPVADVPGPQEVAPPATGVVATPRRLAAEMLDASSHRGPDSWSSSSSLRLGASSPSGCPMQFGG